MLWIGIYLVVATVVSAMLFIAGQWFATGSSKASADHPAALAALAGAIWPVLLIGLTELLLVSKTAHHMGHRAGTNSTGAGAISAVAILRH